ncbi:MAG: hypothetical protein VX185_15925 [Pseudomonadota bacterium]|nr:hypothetical protein [Pseudomonadota bacterium]
MLTLKKLALASSCLLAAQLCSTQAVAANADSTYQLMQQSYLKLDVVDAAYGSAKDFSEYVGAPLVIYFWNDLCDLCLQDIETLNDFAKENHLKAVAIRLGGQKNTAFGPKTQSEIRLQQRLAGFDQIDHLYAPYLKKNQLELQKLPAIQVLNSSGKTAAVYPAFKGQWSEIATLVEQLDTLAFQDYSIQQKPELIETQNKYENPLKLKRISEETLDRDDEQPLFLTQTFFADSSQKRNALNHDGMPASHDLGLTAAGSFVNYNFQTGAKSSSNWQGLQFAYVHPLSIDERLAFYSQFATASGYETQSVAAEIDSPENNILGINYETYLSTTRVAVGLYQETQSYRTDTGFKFDFASMFWKDRTKITVGMDLFSATHEEASTITAADDDTNRRHRVGISHRIDEKRRLVFNWYHDALQGVIENPDEMVDYRFNGGSTLAQQYALYPATKTQNNYVLQLVESKEKYDIAYGYGAYDDSWGTEQHRLFTSINTQVNQWQLQGTARLTHQHRAVMFNDLYPMANAETLMSRNPDLAGFDSLGVGVKGVYPVQWSLWQKPTFVTLGADLDYYDFETLSDNTKSTNVNEREALQELIISTSIGLEIKL